MALPKPLKRKLPLKKQKQLKNQWLKKLLLKNPLNFAGGKQHIPRGRKKAACAAFFIGTHRVVAIKVLAIETENLKFLKLRN
jgi:hypothetical protein